MARVFVAQPSPEKNICRASEFGQLVTVVPSHLRSITDMAEIKRCAERALRDFTSDDYLLLIGDPVIIGVVSAIAAASADWQIRFLKWDNQDRIYFPVVADLREGEAA